MIQRHADRRFVLQQQSLTPISSICWSRACKVLTSAFMRTSTKHWGQRSSLGSRSFVFARAGCLVAQTACSSLASTTEIAEMCKGPPKDGCRVPRQTSGEADEELETRIAQALDCPCVADLKAGPCGELFVTTFTCFQRSKAEPKGCDCLDVSLAFADCIRRHPEVLDDIHKAEDLEKQSGLALPSASQ